MTAGRMRGGPAVLPGTRRSEQRDRMALRLLSCLTFETPRRVGATPVPAVSGKPIVSCPSLMSRRTPTQRPTPPRLPTATG